MEQILINKLQNILKDHRASVNRSLSEVLLKNLNHIKAKTINEIALEANCSKSSVVKFAKYLGLDGYKELIQRLNIEANVLVPQLTLINPFAPTPNQTEIELLSNYYELVSSNLQYIQNNFLQEIIKAAMLIKQSRKIFLFGKGANLNGMQIFANYLMKLNYWTVFSVDVDVQNQYVGNVSEDSVSIIFSYSGLTPEIIDFYHQIKERKGKVILFTSNRFSPMYDEQNITLFILKNEEVQKQQRNSLVSILFIIMELVYLLSN